MKEELGDFIEAAGLEAYDPNAITKIYKDMPNYTKTSIYIYIYIYILGCRDPGHSPESR